MPPRFDHKWGTTTNQIHSYGARYKYTYSGHHKRPPARDDDVGEALNGTICTNKGGKVDFKNTPRVLHSAVNAAIGRIGSTKAVDN